MVFDKSKGWCWDSIAFLYCLMLTASSWGLKIGYQSPHPGVLGPLRLVSRVAIRATSAYQSSKVQWLHLQDPVLASVDTGYHTGMRDQKYKARSFGSDSQLRSVQQWQDIDGLITYTGTKWWTSGWNWELGRTVICRLGIIGSRSNNACITYQKNEGPENLLTMHTALFSTFRSLYPTQFSVSNARHTQEGHAMRSQPYGIVVLNRCIGSTAIWRIEV